MTSFLSFPKPLGGGGCAGVGDRGGLWRLRGVNLITADLHVKSSLEPVFVYGGGISALMKSVISFVK